jgi:hypothetical protein
LSLTLCVLQPPLALSHTPGKVLREALKWPSLRVQREIASSLRAEGQVMDWQWRVRGSQDGVVADKFMRMDHEDDSGDDGDYV